VLKENAVENILDAIAAVANGEHYLSPSVSGHLVRRRGRANRWPPKTRPRRSYQAERRILKLIAGKKTSRQIAAELFISPRTVEAHRANICTKLVLRGSHSLLQFALDNRSCTLSVFFHFTKSSRYPYLENTQGCVVQNV